MYGRFDPFCGDMATALAEQRQLLDGQLSFLPAGFLVLSSEWSVDSSDESMDSSSSSSSEESRLTTPYSDLEVSLEVSLPPEEVSLPPKEEYQEGPSAKRRRTSLPERYGSPLDPIGDFVDPSDWDRLEKRTKVKL